MALNTQRTHTAKLVMRGFQLVCGIIVMSTAAYVLSQFGKLDNEVSSGIAQSQQDLLQAEASGLTPFTFNGTEAEAYQAAVQAALDATAAATGSTNNRKLMQIGYYGSVFAAVKNRLGYVIFAAIVLMLHAAHYLAVALTKNSKITCNLSAVAAAAVELGLTFLIWIFVMAAGGVMASWGTCSVGDIGSVCGSYNAALAFSWIAWLLLLGSMILSILELVMGRNSNAQPAKVMEVGTYGSSAPPQVVVSSTY